MTSQEIIRRVINHDNPPRIGLSFNAPGPNDIAGLPMFLPDYPGSSFGRHEELVRMAPDFPGELMLDRFGNLYGRLNGRTKGECLRGALEEWDALEEYAFPQLPPVTDEQIASAKAACGDKYRLGWCGGLFSILRDLRRMDNLLLDVLMEPARVERLTWMTVRHNALMMRRAALMGADGVIFGDDWGTQGALLVSPALWRKLFAPAYRSMVDEAHALGLHIIMHSCGKVGAIVGDWVDMGMDVLQFDQPGLHGVAELGQKYGGRTSFWCPVDIQTVLATGDRTAIEAEARAMLRYLKPYGGGFIAKDYPSLADIGVADEWAAWASDIFIQNAAYE